MALVEFVARYGFEFFSEGFETRDMALCVERRAFHILKNPADDDDANGRGIVPHREMHAQRIFMPGTIDVSKRHKQLRS